MLRQAVFLIAFVMIMRFLPHPPNFTPVNAVSVYCGAKFGSPCIPIVGMLLSDMIIGFHPLMFVIYPLLVLNVFISTKLDKVCSVLINSLLFFVVTNFSMWLVYYEHTLQSLIECYALAIPFYQYSLMGDVVYSIFIFGLNGLMVQKAQVLGGACE